MLTATSFLLVLLLAALAIALLVVWPLLRKPATDAADTPTTAGIDAESARLNREIIRERRARLDEELAELPEDSPERTALMQAFAQGALADLQPAGTAAAPPRRARSRWIAALVLAVLIVAPPLAFYRTAGVPESVDPAFAARKAQPNMQDLLAELEQRLAEQPELVEGWLLLGRSRAGLREYDKAVAALEKALALDSDDPALASQIRTDLADALGQQAGTKLTGRPWALLQQALALQPDNPKAMALAGAYHLSQQQPTEALRYWEPLLARLEPGSPQHQQVSQYIDNVRKQFNLPATAASPVLSGALQLDEKLAGAVKPDDMVFIAVRGVDENGEAAGPPVAVGRLKVADLPHRFRFSDADAMMPTARLSGQKRVKIIARIGQDASPQPGDLQGESPVVAVDASDVKLVIDQRLP